MLQPYESSARIINQKLKTANSDTLNALNSDRPLTTAGPAGRSVSHGAVQGRTSNLPIVGGIEPAVLDRRESTVEARGSTKSADNVSIGTAGGRHQAGAAAYVKRL